MPVMLFRNRTGSAIPVMLLVLIPLSTLHKFRLKELGLRIDNLYACFRIYFLLGIGTIIGILLFKTLKLNYFITLGIGKGVSFETEGFLVSALSQEFGYRAYLSRILKEISDNKYFLTITISILFAFMHIFLNNFSLTFISFLLSLVWTPIYLKYPNLFLMTLLHLLTLLGGRLAFPLVK